MSVTIQEFTLEEMEKLLKNNKYYYNRRGISGLDNFDVADILINKNIPILVTQGEKFQRTMVVARFITKRKGGIKGIEDGLLYFLSTLGDDLKILFVRRLGLSMLESIANDIRFADLCSKMIRIADESKQ